MTEVSETFDPDLAAAQALMNADAVRKRAHMLLEAGLDGMLAHFAVDLARLDPVADYVVAVTRETYPDLDMPLHSRWRHFELGGTDRWAGLAESTVWPDAAARARAAFDLAIVSVLLDAGAGGTWTYRDPVSGRHFGRSEGLALAGLAMFAGGAFSEAADGPARCDASRLARLGAEELAAGFQVSEGNQLVALDGRAALLRRLGEVVAGRPDLFAIADTPRPGGLFDHIAAQATGGAVSAETILAAVLDGLGPVWPGRLSLAGLPLGDTWRHSAARAEDASNGLVPFHKLSQWLAYSLVEPLGEAGIEVVGLDRLTGLAEYRNGGLFLDMGLVALKEPDEAARAHEPGSELVVEWRALTVALLDRTAEAMRDRLGLDAETLPLGKVLQGGTWAAGRRIARQRRADGAPPLAVVSDGTIF